MLENFLDIVHISWPEVWFIPKHSLHQPNYPTNCLLLCDSATMWHKQQQQQRCSRGIWNNHHLLLRCPTQDIHTQCVFIPAAWREEAWRDGLRLWRRSAGLVKYWFQRQGMADRSHPATSWSVTRVAYTPNDVTMFTLRFKLTPAFYHPALA